MTKKTVNYKFELDPLYLINSESSIDREWLSYTILGAMQKYKAELSKDNLQVFGEIFLHYFNLSTISTLNIIFDKNHRVYGIKNEKNSSFNFRNDQKGDIDNKVLVNIIDILKYECNERNQLLENYAWLKRKLRNVFIQAIEKHIKVHGEMKVYCRNKKIHLQDDIYVFCKISSSFYSEIWRIKTDERKQLMTSVEYVDTIKEIATDDFEKLSEYVNKLKKSDKKINFNNIMVINSDKAIDYSEAIYIIRDILFLNKNLEDLFEVKEYDNDILYMLLEFVNNGGL